MMMRLRVRLFAGARQQIGADHLEIELPDRANIRALRSELASREPRLAAWLSRSVIALDMQYALDEETVIHPLAEVALIPPVSGG